MPDPRRMHRPSRGQKGQVSWFNDGSWYCSHHHVGRANCSVPTWTIPALYQHSACNDCFFEISILTRAYVLFLSAPSAMCLYSFESSLWWRALLHVFACRRFLSLLIRYSVIYKASCQHVGDHVAIKSYDRPSLLPKKQKMATREAIVMRYLNSQG